MSIEFSLKLSAKSHDLEYSRLRKKIYYRGISRPALWCRRTGFIAFLLLCAAFILYRLETVTLIVAFYMLAASSCVAIMSLLLGIIGARQVWNNGDIGASAVANGTFASLVVLAPVVYFAALWALSPAINDLSTDTDQPPFVSGMSDGTDKVFHWKPVANAGLQLSVYPELIGRSIALPSDQAVKVVREVMASHGWENLQEVERDDGLTVYTHTKSPILGLRNDIAVRVFEDDADSYIDMRMISHYGDKELGFNAAVIAYFMQKLDVKLRDELLVAIEVVE